MSDLVKITQTLHDPDNFKNDISAAAALAAQHFKNKYIAPMNELYNEKKKNFTKHPEPHTALLQACRPFVKDTAFLDNMIDKMTACTAINDMIRDYSQTAKTLHTSEKSESVHPDGVYDIDKECIAKKSIGISADNGNGLLLLLLAVLVLNK